MADAHLFKVGQEYFALSVGDGGLFEINDLQISNIEQAMLFDDTERAMQLLAMSGVQAAPLKLEQPPSEVTVKSLSLAIAQKCNFGCTYCYAQQGDFGMPAQNMALKIAKASVDRLIESATEGEIITIAYMGGEPLINRKVLYATTEYAVQQGIKAKVKVRFALTTNGSLLTTNDIKFFQNHRFTVTLSIDGTQEEHDLLRPLKSGRGSYERVIQHIKGLLDAKPRRCRVIARVTVTPRNLKLKRAMDEFIALGFDNVLFSPVLSSPTDIDTMQENDFNIMLEQLIECGDAFEEHISAGKVYPLGNLINTLKRIHNYHRDTYPCGAGGGYMGVSSEGNLFACHRFVNDEAGDMGNVETGINKDKQATWFVERNVHNQKPCSSCWARYMCSGGCHYESMNSGRVSCDYIRGWLHYCLGLYIRLLRTNAELLEQALQLTDFEGG